MNHRIRTRTFTALAANGTVLLYSHGYTPAGAPNPARSRTSTGRLTKPQLTIHTTGDALIPVQAESAHARAASAGGSASLLRQRYVDNAGHCTFSPGEQIAALHTLEARIGTGRWSGTTPADLNARATEADPASQARYVSYAPAAYPRPCDRSHPCDGPRR